MYYFGVTEDESSERLLECGKGDSDNFWLKEGKYCTEESTHLAGKIDDRSYSRVKNALKKISGLFPI